MNHKYAEVLITICINNNMFSRYSYSEDGVWFHALMNHKYAEVLITICMNNNVLVRLF